MQDENSASVSPTNVRNIDNEDLAGGDDLGKLVGDTSFSDVTSDDSSGWMHKIDVTNFQRLTSNSSAEIASNLHEMTPSAGTFSTESTGIKVAVTVKPEEKEDLRLNYEFAYGSAPMLSTPKEEPFAASGRPVDSRHFGSKVSPPQKKFRHRDSSATRLFNGPKCGEIDQQQISIVSSSSDASRHSQSRQYPKPVYSYSCMIALALKNSQTGRLQVAEIYCFMCENYPYFRTAPAGWKNSVRHNLSLNKCFEKVEIEAPGGHGRKCCLWTLNPQKIAKMDQEIRKYREKDPVGVREAYAKPDDMELVEQGLKGMPNKANIYHSGFGRTPLPDIVQQIAVDVHHEESHTAPPFMTVDTTSSFGGAMEIGLQPNYVGVGKSELALKLLKQAAATYGQSQWNRSLSLGHPPCELSTAAAATWPPAHLENNRSHHTPSYFDQCPLEFSPVRSQGLHQLSSPPPYSFSTPVRRSSVAASYSPFSHSQPDTQQRPSSLQQFQSDAASIWRHQNSPTTIDTRPLPVFSTHKQHRTPERPVSCGMWGDGMIGGNNSLLVTPTSESLHRRGTTFGTSLEAAFCAATAHNNSLIAQSIQSDDQLRQHQEGVYPLAFQSMVDNPSDGGLHLTSL